ncbi:YncE family protein [Mycobacterium sp.]|uniref:YncE family protein n=1 Tax=Mycobacterium sp. TaxID=1785 RepID=UPI003F9E4FE8
MTENSTPIGAKVGSIDTLVPAFQVRCSAVNRQEFNEGQAYLLFAERSGHTMTYGMAVADLLALSVVKDVFLSEEPTDIAVTPDGSFIYVAGDEHLFSIQTDTFEVTPLPVLVPAGAIAAAPATTFAMGLLTAVAVTADGSQLLVAGQQQPPDVEDNGYLAVVDTSTNTVQKAITANITDEQAHHIALTPDGRYAITNLQMQRIDIVDLASFTTAKSVMFNPNAVIAMAVDPGSESLFVAVGPIGGGTGSVVVVDLGIKAVVKTFPLPSAPHQLAVSPDGQSLFVMVGQPDSEGGVTSPTLVVLDANLGTQLQPQLQNAGPFAIDPAGQSIYVFDSAAKVLNIFDLNS